jgi:predicted dehydrogenase
VRLGLVGAGSWGRNYIKTIGGLADVRLTGLASRNPDSARIVPPGCSVVADWHELFDPRLVDGVIIATPPQSHAEIGMAAMDRKLPVLIEKPLTMDVSEARALRGKALEKRVIAMVDHTQLFHPAYRKFKSLLPQFGPIQNLRSEAGRVGPFRPHTPVLWDWGPHDVAMCLDIMESRPERASAKIMERRNHGAGRGETVQLELEFPGNTRARILVSNILTQRTRRFIAECALGTLVYDDNASHKLTVQEAGAERAIEFAAGEPPLTALVREFASGISMNRFDSRPIELGLGVVEVLAACAATLHPG